ncbi:(2Fe-2S) ferredoxin domain-containing protein [Sphingomonas sp. KR1UV-12]|uniref:(2Fe-2S) ferredoxin domain-containing protein n=1 Tax=Sphingomonas aurea TaxID=3063994 RepID=A0ABT9EGK7_9SPHN|nr:(2Fe-2S) ferredoxin domain-containing protein [Sphingomonas sp. KR1UV-12]MDP1026029.1 (2Fe-2S) ferredoxin domain-containing protein [Sphingomonas sp. KR1UV-12]
MTKRAKSEWIGVVLVCAKCSKKVGACFGRDGDEPLAKALRRYAGKGRKAKVGVVETRCLKLCPKRAVTVVDARRPAEWLVVAPGEPIDALAERLGITPQA